MALHSLRDTLDHIDRELVRLLAERHGVIEQVARHKAEGPARLRDAVRELEILERVRVLAGEAGVDPHFASSLFEQILAFSVRYQTDHLTDRLNPERAMEALHVAYAGSQGDDSERVAQDHFASREGSATFHGYGSPRAALDALVAGEVAYAVLPIENTLAGSLNDTYALLAQHEVFIVGEALGSETLCLAALEAVPLGMIRRVLVSPLALSQCRAFLSTLRDARIEVVLDVQGPAQAVSDRTDLSIGAIVTEKAAHRHSLHPVRSNIADHEHNVTRYLVVARKPVRLDVRVPSKTSIVFTVSHSKGALLEVLSVLAEQGINLTKLESRPRPDSPDQFAFWADFEGNPEAPEVGRALEQLQSRTASLKVLGTYPRVLERAQT